MSKILVCGGRDYDDWDVLDFILNLLRPSCIVQGGASGADEMAGEWAAKNGVDVLSYPAQWHLHGKAAGPMRNQLMLEDNEDIELCVGFAGGKGTQDMLARAQAAGILTMHIK